MTTSLPPLAGFARRVRNASWFAMAGEPLSAGEREDVAAWLAGLGLADAAPAEAGDWPAAADRIKRTDWDPRWWEAEEARRQALTQVAEARWGERAMMVALTQLIEEVSAGVHGAAAVAAARGGIADPGLIRAAAGAATMAAHQAAVEEAAGEVPGGPFAAKFRLFEGGHWPLCLHDGRFWVL